MLKGRSSPYFADSTYCRYGYDSEAFLFSLVNGPGWAPVKLNQSGDSRRQYSIYSCSYYGPTFGGGHDINIADNAAYSNSYLYTYSLPSGYSYSSSSFLAGSYYFTPDETETFFYKTFVPPGEILFRFTYWLILLLFYTWFLRTRKFSRKNILWTLHQDHRGASIKSHR